MLNKVILQGRLTAIPELRHTKTEKAVTDFSIAVEDSHLTAGERNTHFFRCEAWNATAEMVCKYFDKGQMILVEGQLRTKKYTDKNGGKHTDVFVSVDSVNFCGSKSAAAQERDIENSFENCEPEDLPFE